MDCLLLLKQSQFVKSRWIGSFWIHRWRRCCSCLQNKCQTRNFSIQEEAAVRNAPKVLFPAFDGTNMQRKITTCSMHSRVFRLCNVSLLISSNLCPTGLRNHPYMKWWGTSPDEVVRDLLCTRHTLDVEELLAMECRTFGVTNEKSFVLFWHAGMLISRQAFFGEARSLGVPLVFCARRPELASA